MCSPGGPAGPLGPWTPTPGLPFSPFSPRGPDDDKHTQFGYDSPSSQVSAVCVLQSVSTNTISTSGSRLAILSITAGESRPSRRPLLSLRSWRPLSARLSRRPGNGADRHRLTGNVVQNGIVPRHVTCGRRERETSDTQTQSQHAVRLRLCTHSGSAAHTLVWLWLGQKPRTGVHPVKHTHEHQYNTSEITLLSAQSRYLTHPLALLSLVSRGALKQTEEGLALVR